MSASQHRYTCAELGMCEARSACMECERPTVPVIRMINSRRVHTIDEPVPFQAVRAPTEPPRPRALPHVPQPAREPEHRLTGWFWFLFGAGVSVLLSGIVLYAR
jgi:hypothetical protein